MNQRAEEFRRHAYQLRKTLAELRDPAGSLLTQLAAAESLVERFEISLPLVDISPYAALGSVATAAGGDDAHAADATAAKQTSPPYGQRTTGASRRADSPPPTPFRSDVTNKSTGTRLGTTAPRDKDLIGVRSSARDTGKEARSHRPPSSAATTNTVLNQAGTAKATVQGRPVDTPGPPRDAQGAEILEGLVNDFKQRSDGHQGFIPSPRPPSKSNSDSTRQPDPTLSKIESPRPDHSTFATSVNSLNRTASPFSARTDPTVVGEASSLALLGRLADGLLTRTSAKSPQAVASPQITNHSVDRLASNQSLAETHRSEPSALPISPESLHRLDDSAYPPTNISGAARSLSSNRQPAAALNSQLSSADVLPVAAFQSLSDADLLATLVNEALAEQARRQGIDLT